MSLLRKNICLGTTSNITSTFNCNGTIHSTTWKLVDAGNNTAKWISHVIYTGAIDFVADAEYTVDSSSKVTYLKMNMDYKNSVTAVAEGAVQ